MKTNAHQFLETSFGYDLSQRVLAYFLSKKSVKELSKRLKKVFAKNVLDIGCATAFYRDDIPVKNFTGIDISNDFIKTAKKRFPGDKFFVMDSANLTFPKDTFDTVISKGVLHHLPEKKLIKSIKESLRVTRRKGHVIILDAIQPIDSWNIFGKFLRNLDQGHNILHSSDYKSLLKKHFILDEFKIYSSFPYDICIYTISKSKNPFSTSKPQ
ncbi:MAG: methyltransferase domain-containing protein [Patescibacteria group bacterium]